VNHTEFLELRDALAIIRRLAIGPVRDLGLLDSALARPRTMLFGVDAYPTLSEKAGALLHSLVMNHPLIDGNKRLAWLAALVFLDLNEHETTLSNDEAFNLVWSAASGELDHKEIAKALRIRPLK
jgi:death-on-curing protein